MKKILTLAIFFVLASVLAFSSTSKTYAAGAPIYGDEACKGKTPGDCVDNYKCEISGYDKDKDGNRVPVITRSKDPNCNSSAIGGVTPPGAINSFNGRASIGGGPSNRGESIGIIVFVSNLLKVFAIVAGMWAMFNLAIAGYTFITSMSDAGAMDKVKNSMTMTVIGLAIIAGAYIIAAVIGALMFGDANFILKPEITGALQSANP